MGLLANHGAELLYRSYYAPYTARVITLLLVSCVVGGSVVLGYEAGESEVFELFMHTSQAGVVLGIIHTFWLLLSTRLSFCVA